MTQYEWVFNSSPDTHYTPFGMKHSTERHTWMHTERYVEPRPKGERYPNEAQEKDKSIRHYRQAVDGEIRPAQEANTIS